MIVNRFYEVKHLDHVYALGDIAYMETPKYPHGHPQVASVALQQAEAVSQKPKKHKQT